MNPPRMTSRRWFWGLLTALSLWMLWGVHGTGAAVGQMGIARRIEFGVNSVCTVLLTPLSASAHWLQITGSNMVFGRRSDISPSYVRQLEDDNRQLKNLVYLLNGQNEEYQQKLKELNQLQKSFPSITAQNVMPANITILSPSGSGNQICDIDKGHLDGVREKMVVLADLAPVGRVIYAGPKNAKIRLITDRDRSMRIDARIDREMSDGSTLPIVGRCQVYGTGTGELRCDDVSAVNTIEPKIGDILRVNDKQWPQIPGAIIGTVVGVSRKDNMHLRYDLKIAPRVNINHTDRVVVLLAQ